MTPRKKLPSVEALNAMFYIKDGQLYWAVNLPRKAPLINQLAGHEMEDGRRRVSIDKSYYLTHRIICKMTTGEEPPDRVLRKTRAKR